MSFVILCSATHINHYLNQLSQITGSSVILLYFFKKGLKVLATVMQNCSLAKMSGSFRAVPIVSKDSVPGFGSVFFYSGKVMASLQEPSVPRAGS